MGKNTYIAILIKTILNKKVKNMSKHPRAEVYKSKIKKTPSVKWNFPLEKLDLICLAIGVGFVVIGFLLMSTGITDEIAVPDGKWNNVFAVNIAPFFLFIGYCVVIPMALFKFFSRRKAAKKATINTEKSLPISE
jgi:hypothetical protein